MALTTEEKLAVYIGVREGQIAGDEGRFWVKDDELELSDKRATASKNAFNRLAEAANGSEMSDKAFEIGVEALDRTLTGRGM